MSSHLHKPIKEVDGLSLYFEGDIAIIVMNRGQNRVNLTFLNAFQSLLDEVESNESCKGLITTGTGKFYSNGLDLDLMATMSEEETGRIPIGLIFLLKRILCFPIPTLAAINGHSFAAGAILSFAHDLRTMNSEKGWICLNEVFINLRLGTFNFMLLESKFGKGRNISDALILGKRFTAQESLKVGLVHSIQPPTLLIHESMNVLKSYYKGGYPRSSLKGMKEDVYKDLLQYYESKQIDRLYEENVGDVSLTAKL